MTKRSLPMPVDPDQIPSWARKVIEHAVPDPEIRAAVYAGGRTRRLSDARWEMFAALRLYEKRGGLNPSLPEIGAILGVDHTTVSYGLKRRAEKLVGAQAFVAEAWSKQKAYAEQRRQHRIAAYEAGLIQEPPTAKDLEEA